LRCFK